jgi:hypothetical protein
VLVGITEVLRGLSARSVAPAFGVHAQVVGKVSELKLLVVELRVTVTTEAPLTVAIDIVAVNMGVAPTAI